MENILLRDFNINDIIIFSNGLPVKILELSGVTTCLTRNMRTTVTHNLLLSTKTATRATNPLLQATHASIQWQAPTCWLTSPSASKTIKRSLWTG